MDETKRFTVNLPLSICEWLRVGATNGKRSITKQLEHLLEKQMAAEKRESK